MNQLPPTSPESTRPPAIEWIRKRDGEVVRFEIDKLTASLQLAAEELTEPLTADVLAELARMAMFFVAGNVSASIIGTEDIAEWVQKSLCQTGHSALAHAYSRYRDRKRWAAGSLIVRDAPAELPGETPAGSHWNKSRIVQSLRIGLNLDARRSREIATRVERTILTGRFGRLTSGLVREMVNNELAARGIRERLEPPGEVRIATAELKRQLAEPGGTAAAGRTAAGRIWRDFALSEIVSSDVSAAVRRGLLRVRGLQSPASLAATCVDCRTLVRQASGSRDSIGRLGARLAQAAQSSSAQIAIDRVEPWLALVADDGESPAQLTELLWQELNSRLRHCDLECVLNLYGGFGEGTNLDVGAGPLFGRQPTAAESEFASSVSDEILGRFQRDAVDWPGVRVDWHWSPSRAAETARWQRVGRLAAEGGPVAFAFERETIPLGDGMRRAGDSVRPVLDYVGVHLPLVWRDAGSPHALSAFEDGLTQAIQLAVRAAVQRREFLRRLPGAVEPSLIDHAVLAVAPIGLDWTVRQLTGKSFAEDDGSLILAENLARHLREATEREARCFALGVIVDAPSGRGLDAVDWDAGRSDDAGEELPGLLPTEQGRAPRRRMHAAGRLHAVAGAGTLTSWLGPEATGAWQPLAETIDWAARNTELVRLRLAAERHESVQATVTWPEP